MPKKKIKRRPVPSSYGDVGSDSGYLLPKRGFKRNAAAYGNIGRSIKKHQRKNRDFNGYEYGKQGRYS